MYSSIYVVLRNTGEGHLNKEGKEKNTKAFRACIIASTSGAGPPLIVSRLGENCKVPPLTNTPHISGVIRVYQHILRISQSNSSEFDFILHVVLDIVIDAALLVIDFCSA